MYLQQKGEGGKRGDDVKGKGKDKGGVSGWQSKGWGYGGCSKGGYDKGSYGRGGSDKPEGGAAYNIDGDEWSSWAFSYDGGYLFMLAADASDDAEDNQASLKRLHCAKLLRSEPRKLGRRWRQLRWGGESSAVDAKPDARSVDAVAAWRSYEPVIIARPRGAVGGVIQVYERLDDQRGWRGRGER